MVSPISNNHMSEALQQPLLSRVTSPEGRTSNGAPGVRTGPRTMIRLNSWRRVRNPVPRRESGIASIPEQPRSAFHPLEVARRLGVVAKDLWKFFTSSPSTALLSAKSGFAVTVMALLIVFAPPGPYGALAKTAVWAVVTIDVLTEANVGLSHSKGVNRVAGALAGGVAALIVNKIGPNLHEGYPYFVLVMAFIGGYVPRYLKSMPPFKEDWAYAMTAGMITFHILILVGHGRQDRGMLPYLRFSMIVFGFFWASVVNLAFKPVYAGDTLAALVAKNFQTCAVVLEKCVDEYCRGTELDHLPEIYSGKSVDDKIYQSYEEIFMSDSTVDKHLKAAYWEPPHGKYFWGYPWPKYDVVADYLRYTLHDVIALDACLRAEIQAPQSLRDIFSDDMQVIAKECGVVLRGLGQSIKDMRRYRREGHVERAQEACLSLQHNIYKHTPLLLGAKARESPRYAMYLSAANHPLNSPQGDALLSNVIQSPSPKYAESNASSQDITGTTAFKTPDSAFKTTDGEATPIHGSASIEDFSFHMKGNATTSTRDGAGSGHLSADSPRSASSAGSQPPLRAHSSGERSKWPWVGNLEDGEEGESRERTMGENGEGVVEAHPLEWQQSLMRHKEKMGREFEGCLERISALSFVKFSSLLIELVAKVKYVVAVVDDLATEARFLPPVNSPVESV